MYVEPGQQIKYFFIQELWAILKIGMANLPPNIT